VLHLYVLVRAQVIVWRHRLLGRLAAAPRPAEAGQATAEYALVLLGVAALALLVLAWAGGTDKVGELLDAVIDSIIDQV
jgi:hypothetical protein